MQAVIVIVKLFDTVGTCLGASSIGVIVKLFNTVGTGLALSEEKSSKYPQVITLIPACIKCFFYGQGKPCPYTICYFYRLRLIRVES